MLMATGQVNAVVYYDLKPYDFLVLTAVIEAAVGPITDWQGNDLTFTSDGRVVAAVTEDLNRNLLGLLHTESAT